MSKKILAGNMVAHEEQIEEVFEQYLNFILDMIHMVMMGLVTIRG
jgi:hypothetical protein